MPSAGKMWRHVIISARRSWLHGDGRGFRDREHRLHSSGDYKDPPPEGEHEGLHAFFKKRAKGKALKIPVRLRGEVGIALIRTAASEEGWRVLTVAVAQKHAHLLVELPRDRATVKLIVGKRKSARTKVLREKFTGTLWGEGGKYKPVRKKSHQVNAFDYIAKRQGPKAWAWNFKEGTPLKAKPRHKKRR